VPDLFSEKARTCRAPAFDALGWMLAFAVFLFDREASRVFGPVATTAVSVAVLVVGVLFELCGPGVVPRTDTGWPSPVRQCLNHSQV